VSVRGGGNIHYSIYHKIAAPDITSYRVLKALEIAILKIVS
jgi:hypothetical protein